MAGRTPTPAPCGPPPSAPPPSSSATRPASSASKAGPVASAATTKSKKEVKKDGLALGYAPDLEPLTTHGEIFEHMTERAWELGLSEAMNHLQDKKLRVATMCSGTDAPVLALQQMVKCLFNNQNQTLGIEHVFSCEIEVRKAKFIERNTEVPLIFRDVREVAFNGYAATHYGAGHPVPQNLDVVIAGFSCKDFSRVNPRPKRITDLGESGDTFRAIRMFARRNLPNFLILENVTSAPWEKEIYRAFQPKSHKQFWDGFNDNGTEYPAHPGYAAVHAKLDTMNYYLPQSRNRGYMILVNRAVFGTATADTYAKDWLTKVVALKRQTSVSAEGFLLNSDDPRLHQGRNQVTRDSGNGRQVVVEWSTSANRHSTYRDAKQLGKARPILKWTEQGASEPRDFTWIPWNQRQVQRIKDSIEINTLRNVVRYNADSEYKLRFWNLSQNIDRNLDTMKLGIVECLTPTGIYYHTLRGGPLTGHECLSLQGLPIDKLLVSRETDRELLDLAGNAMSATVVAAAVISGIILLAEHLGKHNTEHSQMTPKESAIVVCEEKLQSDKLVDLEHKPEHLQDLPRFAGQSIRLCYCEGQLSNTQRALRICTDCLFSSCSRCGGNPEHNYGPFGVNIPSPRLDPQEFRAKLKDNLPMRLCVSIENLDLIREDALESGLIGETQAQSLHDSLSLALREDLRFSSIKRNHCWTVTYKAPHSHLDFVVTPSYTEWLLYAEPAPKEAGNSPVRELLTFPVARLRLTSKSFFEGQWELRRPIATIHRLRITPVDDSQLIPTWDSTLGLQVPEFIDKRVWDKVNIETAPPSHEPELVEKITGTFKRLPKCDTAFASLYLRIPATQAPAKQETPVFLFLESARCDISTKDSFVFSHEKHRLEYGEQRDVIGKLQTHWRPTDQPLSEVDCTILARWMHISGTLESFKAKVAPTYAGIPHDVLLDVSMAGKSCATAGAAILSCKVPLKVDEKQFWGAESSLWTSVLKTHQKTVLSALSFLLTRTQTLENFPRGWRPLALESGKRLQLCDTCAPAEPELKWELNPNKNKLVLLPHEDETQAFEFEKAMNARLEPFLVQLRMDLQGAGCLRIVLNIATLVHRAMGRLQAIPRRINSLSTSNVSAEWTSDEEDNKKPRPCFQWRLDTKHLSRRSALPKFYLRSNRRDRCAKHQFDGFFDPKNPKLQSAGEFQLRQDQQQSLRWMSRRENPSSAAYVESETVEATLDQLAWRADARAEIKCPISGGICSDQVGYGKTIITIALIDSTMADAERFAGHGFRHDAYPGRIPLKATLIVLPSTLCKQWHQEIGKFTGHKLIVLAVETTSAWQRLTIEGLRKAHIIIVSWQVFKSESYSNASARVGAIPPAPSSGGRDFGSWLSRALQKMSTNVDKLIGSVETETVQRAAATISQDLLNAHEDKDLVRNIPLKPGRGQKYQASSVPYHQREKDRKEQNENKVADFAGALARIHKVDPFGLEHASSLNKGKGIPLHCFAFFRLVLDEHSYVVKNGRIRNHVETLTASHRWVLSGTPPLSGFADVSGTFKLIGGPLGVEDDNVGSMSAKAVQELRNKRSAAESFRAFDNIYSPDWYEGRHLHVQKALDLHARQNHIPLDSRIKSKDIVVAVPLAAVERAFYHELHQALFASSMRLVKPVALSNLDLRNVQERILVDSKTGEEALVRCASTCPYVGPIQPSTLSIYRALLRQRQSRLALFTLYLFKMMKKAVFLLNARCGDPADDGQENPEGNRGSKEEVNGGEAEVYPDDPDAEDAIAEESGLEAQRGQSGSWTARKSRKPPKAKAKAAVKTKRDEDMAYWTKFKSDIEGITQGDAQLCEVLRLTLQLATDSYSPTHASLFFAPVASPPVKKGKAPEFKPPKPWLDRRGAGKRLLMPPMPPANTGRFALAKDVMPAQGAESVTALRNVVQATRKLITRWKIIFRSLCYLQATHLLQTWMRFRSEAMPPPIVRPICSKCEETAQDPDKIAVLGVCGHLSCLDCLGEEHNARQCPKSDCLQTAAKVNVVSGAAFGALEDRYFRYGSKIDAMLDTIHQIPRKEQILIFVQYTDLGTALEIALETEGIKFYSLLDGGNKTVKAMNDFREHSDPKDPKWRQVLVLDSTSESAAGANLVGANHVMFMSPMVAEDDHQYQQSYTQCVGRACRPGQTKVVSIYKFVSLKTVDVDIYEERSGLKLSLDPITEAWLFMKEKDITGLEATTEEKKTWGSGYRRANFEDDLN